MSSPAYTVVHETYGYEHLRGPNGEVCSLTEREDRTWGRDLSPVLTLLNVMHADIEHRIKRERELNDLIVKLTKRLEQMDEPPSSPTL